MSTDFIINEIKNDNFREKAKEKIKRIAKVWKWKINEAKLIKVIEMKDSVAILIEARDSVHQFYIEEDYIEHKPISKFMLKIIFDNVELN